MKPTGAWSSVDLHLHGTQRPWNRAVVCGRCRRPPQHTTKSLQEVLLALHADIDIAYVKFVFLRLPVVSSQNELRAASPTRREIVFISTVFLNVAVCPRDVPYDIQIPAMRGSNTHRRCTRRARWRLTSDGRPCIITMCTCSQRDGRPYAIIFTKDRPHDRIHTDAARIVSPRAAHRWSNDRMNDENRVCFVKKFQARVPAVRYPHTHVAPWNDGVRTVP